VKSTRPAHTKHALAALALLAILVPRGAPALPEMGTSRPNLQLVDAWERTYPLSDVGVRPLLVLYEDKGSVTQNLIFKRELSELAQGDGVKARIVLAAVADVADYDYWPVRGFVKNEIKDESRKAGTPIYCDWDGHVRRAFGVRRGASNVVLFGRDGKVVFAYEGAMPDDARKRAIDLMRREIQP
jgi:hypothetical protein